MLMDAKISWPGWETVRLIGRGSFGAVYEIQRNLFGGVEKAALKVISIPQNASDIEEMYNDGYDEESITSTFQSYLESIVAEYSLMRKMNGSANIVSCDDVRYVQHDDGIGWDIFIKMELLTPLTKALPGQIPEETVMKIAEDMCAALELCKKHNIIHRDIKPQNIFVSDNGDYKLGDFGIAKTVEKTTGGTKIGTYKYMAPEVYHNRPYGAAADIYSLGLVLYWMLNERRMPFLPLPPEKLTAGMEERARNRRLSGEALHAPVHGSPELRRIVLKACAYDPRDRYSSPTEMLWDLQGISSAEAAMAFRPAAEDGDATVGMFSQGNAPGDLTVAMFHKDMPSSGEAARRREETQARLIREQQERERLLRAQAEQEAQANRQKTEKKRLPVAAIAAAVLIIALLIGYFTVHIWTDADCVNPAECKLCGKTKGSAAGHKWIAGSCTEARSCFVCGEKDGNPLGHQWLDATCTAPQTCSRCGATMGTLGHRWMDATYKAPKTCSLCGETEGSKRIPTPVYINELTHWDKYGKLWTMSEQKPNYYAHGDIDSAEAYKDLDTPGHTTGAVYDHRGNRYTYGLQIDGPVKSEYYVSYNIEGIYTTFTGICAMSADMDGDDRASSNTKYFEVWGDGKLLFRSLDMSQNSDPQKFTVDISDVQILTIRYPKTLGPSRIATIFDGKLS